MLFKGLTAHPWDSPPPPGADKMLIRVNGEGVLSVSFRSAQSHDVRKLTGSAIRLSAPGRREVS